MYRVNVYARCTAMKMTGGLSYCLHIVAAISLHIGSLSAAAHYDSSNLTDIMDSRQFRQNMEVSKHRDNPHWLENYKHKPLKHHKIKKRPFWESNVATGPWSNDSKDKEVANWEGIMRKITGERLKKWSAQSVKGKLDASTSENDEVETVHDSQQQPESVEDITENSKNADSEQTSTILSEETTNSPTEKSLIDSLKKDEILGNMVLPYRWGMSKNRPPDEIIKKILKNDIHKLHSNDKILRDNEVDDADDDDNDEDEDESGDMSARIASDIESDESTKRSNPRSKVKRKHPPKHKPKINDTSIRPPMLLPKSVHADSSKTADSSSNTYEKNQHLHEIDAIHGTEIRTTDERSQIISPILVLGPTIYVADLPKVIKQKLRIHRPIIPQNRIQSRKIIGKSNGTSSREHDQRSDPEFSGIYEFY